MLLRRTLHLLVATAAMLTDSRTDAASAAVVKLCGRKLSEIMSRVCHAYNSPSWDDPRVVEQPAAVVRRRRQVGIADQCCTYGCTWEQLNEYCAISANSDPQLAALEAHMIADRSAEQAAPATPCTVPSEASAGAGPVERREVGRGRSRGYGRTRRRGRRCRCRRRRSGRRRTSRLGAHKKCSARCTRSRHRVAPADLGQNPQH